jgi:ribokinase
MKNNCVTCFGDINVDVIMSVNVYPQAAGDAMATQVRICPGGSIANTAIVLAKLGVSVKIISKVGDDPWADISLRPLTELNIDLRDVTQDPDDSTGLIFIPVLPSGERTMFSYRGANVRKSPHEIRDDILNGSTWLHFSSYNFLVNPQKEATWKIIEIARGHKIDISVDIGVEPAKNAADDIKKAIPYLTLIVLSLEEAKEILGNVTPEIAIKHLVSMGAKVVGIKLGRDGCIIGDQDGIARIPGLQIQAVDTTGAGDAFCAGLIYAQQSGFRLEKAGFLANALGALAATVWGGGPALPGKDDLIRFVSQQDEYIDFYGYRQTSGEVLNAL